MFFKCKKEEIAKAVFKAEKIARKNINLPLLQCIDIEAKKEGCFIRSTNIDLSLEVKVQAKIEKEGRVIIPSNILNSFLSNIKNNDNIEIEEKNKNIQIKSSLYKVLIKTLPKNDFPDIPKIKNGDLIKINSKKFTEGLKAVFFSVSISNIKPELSSIFIINNNKKIKFVSTDSFRLSEKIIKTDKNNSFKDILIPQKNINEIIQIIEDEKNTIEIFINEDYITFNSNSFKLLSRIIDGNFPDYEQIIPKEFKTEIIVLKEEIVGALKLTNVFSDKFNQTSLETKNNKFFIKTKSPDFGSSSVEVVSEVQGENVSINFNHKFIFDCFQSINTDNVKLSFAGQGKPLLIKEYPTSTYSYIVMPMNK